MSKRNVLPTNPTATQVRQALGLPTNVRGNLSQSVIDQYNKGKRADKRYVRGNTKTAKAARDAQRATLVAAGVAGKRGPLGAKAREFLAQPKG